MGINWLAIRGAAISTAAALIPGLYLAYHLATRASKPLLAVLAILLVVPFFLLLHPAVPWQAPVAAAFAALPVLALAVRPPMQTANHRYGNAARGLGASEWRIFWRILVPHSWPIVIAAAALAFIRVLAEWL